MRRRSQVSSQTCALVRDRDSESASVIEDIVLPAYVVLDSTFAEKQQAQRQLDHAAMRDETCGNRQPSDGQLHSIAGQVVHR